MDAIATELQQSIHSERRIYQVFQEEVVALGLRGGISLLDEAGEFDGTELSEPPPPAPPRMQGNRFTVEVRPHDFRALEAFRRDYPDHPLAASVPPTAVRAFCASWACSRR